MRFSLLIVSALLALGACTKSTPANNVVAYDTNAMTEAMNDMANSAMEASNAADNAAAAATNAADNGVNVGGNVSSSNLSTSNSSTSDGPADAPDSRGFLYCELAGSRLSVDDCAYFQDLYRRLETGDYALNAAPRMTVGVPATVSFAAARPPSRARPDQPTANEMVGGVPTETGRTRVARNMTAHLEGAGFSVNPAGLVEGDLTLGTANWTWTVTPTQAGHQRLILTAYANVRAPSGGTGRSLLKTLTHDVDVSVAPAPPVTPKGVIESITDWLSSLNNLLLALTGVIATAGGLFAAWLKWWKKKDDGTDHPDGAN